MNALCKLPRVRLLFALAGTMTILGATLAVAVSPWFLLLIAAVGVNQWVFAASGECPASLAFRRVCAHGGGGR
jgi:hypothetical protein